MQGAEDFTMGFGYIGWLKHGIASFTATLPITLDYSGEGTLLANNVWDVCVGTAAPFSCTSSYTSVNFPANVKQLVGGRSTYLALATTTVYADGLPVCGVEPCASFSDDLGILPIPNLSHTTRIAMGYQRACAIDNNSVTCWGSSTRDIPLLVNPVDVSVFNTGVCVQSDFVSCTGFPPYQSAGKPGDIVQCDDLATSVCVSCPLGYDVTSGVCEPCPAGFIRSVGMTQCEACPPYTSASSNTCVTCPQRYLVPGCSVSCNPGSQSNATRDACVSCPSLTARNMEDSCTFCGTLSLPNTDQTECLTCTLPFSLLFTTQTKYSDATCVRAPDGYFPYGTSWTSCPPSTYRVGTMTTCTLCDDGFTDFSRTTCIPCPFNTIRVSKNPLCYSCPSGTLANYAQTQCMPINPGGISTIRLVGISTGGFLLFVTLLFYSHAPPVARIALLLLGACILGLSIAKV